MVHQFGCFTTQELKSFNYLNVNIMECKQASNRIKNYTEYYKLITDQQDTYQLSQFFHKLRQISLPNFETSLFRQS